MSRLQLAQRTASWIAVAAGLLGLLTSGGCGPVPVQGAGPVPGLHLLLLGLGLMAGFLTVSRAEEIDARRWELVQDPLLTSGEREYAHRDAESSRRWAGTVFLAAPVLLGYWWAYQFGGRLDRALASDLLPVTPLVAFGGGLWIASRRARQRSGSGGETAP